MVPQRDPLEIPFNYYPDHGNCEQSQLKKELMVNNLGKTIVLKNQWKYETLKSYEEYLLACAQNIVNNFEEFMGIIRIERQSGCKYRMCFTSVLQTDNEGIQDIEVIVLKTNDQYKMIAKAIADSLFGLGDRVGIEQFQIRLKQKLDKLFYI